MRWVRHQEERRVRYDQVGARSIRRELDDRLRCTRYYTSNILISSGLDLGPKRDDESRGDWPVREAVGSLL